MKPERRNGLTWMEWQNQGQLPYGFANSGESYHHWDQGNDLGWAIYCFNKSTQGRCGHICSECGGNGKYVFHGCLNGPCSCQATDCKRCDGTGIALATDCCRKSVDKGVTKS